MAHFKKDAIAPTYLRFRLCHILSLASHQRLCYIEFVGLKDICFASQTQNKENSVFQFKRQQQGTVNGLFQSTFEQKNCC